MSKYEKAIYRTAQASVIAIMCLWFGFNLFIYFFGYFLPIEVAVFIFSEMFAIIVMGLIGFAWVSGFVALAVYMKGTRS